MRSYLDFSAEEKTMILEAIKHKKELEMSSYEDENKFEFEYFEEINEEIKKQNIFLSRSQLSTIETLLGPLIDTKQFKQLDIIALEDKINDILELP